MNELQTVNNHFPVVGNSNAMVVAGEAANRAAAQNVFADYISRKADNTIKAQGFDLQVFSQFLGAAGLAVDAGDLQNNPAAWAGVTWGIVEAFVKWQLQDGYTIASINRRLSTIKVYAKLAAKAGVLSAQDYALIKTVSGYGDKEGKRVDEKREVTSKGTKKGESVAIDDSTADALKSQPDSPQGRRDALLMALLLDHGLRCGEVAALQVSDFNLKAGTMVFDRPKVGKVQTHKLSADALRALYAWVNSGDCPAEGPLLRGSRKGGKLTDAGMSETAITTRVRTLAADLGVVGMSAHDCRHYWATKWAGKVDILRLQEAGGWSSLIEPRRYVEWAQVANEGMQ